MPNLHNCYSFWLVCVLAKDSKYLLQVPNILLSYFILKDIQTTEGDFEHN
jgi:hypothetical protein